MLESFRRLSSLSRADGVETPILPAFVPLPAARQTFKEPIYWESEISSYRSSKLGLAYLVVMGFVTVPGVQVYLIPFQLFTVRSKNFQLPLYEHNHPGFKL